MLNLQHSRRRDSVSGRLSKKWATFLCNFTRNSMLLLPAFTSNSNTHSISFFLFFGALCTALQARKTVRNLQNFPLQRCKSWPKLITERRKNLLIYKPNLNLPHLQGLLLTGEQQPILSSIRFRCVGWTQLSYLKASRRLWNMEKTASSRRTCGRNRAKSTLKI